MSRNKRAWKVHEAQRKNDRIKDVKDGIDTEGMLIVDFDYDYERMIVENTDVLSFLRKCKGFKIKIKIEVLEKKEDWSKY